MDKNMKKFFIIIISVTIALLLIWSIYFVTRLLMKNSIKNTNEDLYNKELYVSATLPNITGNTNSYTDDFGRKVNSSTQVNEDKKWMNLNFTDFEVYSVAGKNSVIKFTISNNNNIIIESSKFQLQLKDDSANVVAVVDFDSVVLPSTGKINVTVDVIGDIANVKELIIDNINYTMQEVK